MRELIDKGFVAPTEAVAWYWLNPDFMWNGDRLAFVREYRRKGRKFADPRQDELPFIKRTTPHRRPNHHEPGPGVPPVKGVASFGRSLACGAT